MIYCLHHYSIPLFWRWQWVHLESCKSFDLLQQRLGLPQTVGDWYLHLSCSQHHFRRPNHPRSRNYGVVGMCTSRDWGVRLLGDHWVLLTPALVPAAPCQAPQASWCCTNCTGLAPAQGAGWRAAPAQRQARLWEAFAHKWELHAHTWGLKHLGIPVLDICVLKS